MTEDLLSAHVQSLDCVYYDIYNLKPASAPTSPASPSACPGLEQLPPEVLEAICREYTDYLQATFIQDYIWQEEGFGLGPCADPPGLAGHTTFGDNLDDEWFIIFLLFRLSIQYPHAVISVRDNDGEVLLIEAAVHIPDWLTPKNSENRVWIQSGQIHIIPPEKPNSKSHEVRALTVADGVKWMASDLRAKSLASDKIQKAIQDRIKMFPESARESSAQWTKCLLPITVAHLLKQNPALIAPAVTAFYNRDPILLKDATKMRRFGTSPIVPTMARFTRCLYAQLQGQTFHPPLAFGNIAKTHSDYSAFTMGARLAVGFEILYAEQLRKRKQKRAAQVGAAYNFEGDSDWVEYNQRLDTSDYFKHVQPGTKIHSSLLNRAKLKFLEAQPDAKFPTFEWPKQTLDMEIDHLLKSQSDLKTSDFGPEKLFAETPTKWMEISPSDLDQILAQRQAEIEAFEAASGDVPDGKRSKEESRKGLSVLDSIVKEMDSFMAKSSGLEGVNNKEEAAEKSEVEALMIKMKQSLSKLKKVNQQPTSDESDEEKDFYQMGSDEEGEEDGDAAELEEGEESLTELMAQMDRELQSTTLADTYERTPTQATAASASAANPPKESAGDEEELAPIDVDLGLVKNFLESLTAQQGGHGPVASLLQHLNKPK